MKDYYKTLGLIGPGVTQQEIRKAFRILARKYHPDTTSLNEETSRKLFAEITEAYNVLSDEEQKQLYDVIWNKYFSTKTDDSVEFATTKNQNVDVRDWRNVFKDFCKHLILFIFPFMYGLGCLYAIWDELFCTLGKGHFILLVIIVMLQCLTALYALKYAYKQLSKLKMIFNEIKLNPYKIIGTIIAIASIIIMAYININDMTNIQGTPQKIKAYNLASTKISSLKNKKPSPSEQMIIFKENHYDKYYTAKRDFFAELNNSTIFSEKGERFKAKDKSLLTKYKNLFQSLSLQLNYAKSGNPRLYQSVPILNNVSKRLDEELSLFLRTIPLVETFLRLQDDNVDTFTKKQHLEYEQGFLSWMFLMGLTFECTENPKTDFDYYFDNCYSIVVSNKESTRITKENFDIIKNGDTYLEVVRLFQAVPNHSYEIKNQDNNSSQIVNKWSNNTYDFEITFDSNLMASGIIVVKKECIVNCK